MKWKKIGKIFDPTEFKLSNGYEFAQSPQVLVFDEYVRIYFSSRVRTENGKYLSHVNFIDMDKKFQKVINISKETVIELGTLGSFDEHGIFPFNVLKDGNKILAYTTGWNRKVSVSVDAGIGYAFSEDYGTTFKKLGRGPILSTSLDEPFLVGDAFVSKYDEVYHMWYIYGSKWIVDDKENEPQRVYKIAHATSSCGLNWKKEKKNIIDDKLNENECQALPTVVYHNGKYHMFFCYRNAIGFRNNRDKSYRIGYAYSEDLNNWIRNDENVGIDVSESEDSWDFGMICYPHVFMCEEKMYMLYNGNEFGRFGFGIAILEEN